MKLKEKYRCEDYESIVAYVFDFVFVKKNPRKQCIETMNIIFNNKADVMINYLWEITKKYENEDSNEFPEENQQDVEDYPKGSNFSKRGGKISRGRGMKIRGRKSERFNKYYKSYKNERSRSNSHNKYDYEDYQPYPPQQKGYYHPPNPRFHAMLHMRGGYPAYYPPQIIPPYIQR